jgi:hypothetical protein
MADVYRGVYRGNHFLVKGLIMETTLEAALFTYARAKWRTAESRLGFSLVPSLQRYCPTNYPTYDEAYFEQ